MLRLRVRRVLSSSQVLRVKLSIRCLLVLLKLTSKLDVSHVGFTDGAHARI